MLSSKTVKATDFKFDMHVSPYSPTWPLNFFGKGSVCKNSLGADSFNILHLPYFVYVSSVLCLANSFQNTHCGKNNKPHSVTV